ncbi:hypothetical protein WDU94_006110 [Cyamophila willieti]
MVLVSDHIRLFLLSLILVVCSLSVVKVEAYGELRALKLKLLTLLGHKLNPKTVLRSADAICLDVDSTVFTTESVDDLTEFMNKTKETKNESVADVYARLLNFQRPPKISPGAVDLIHCLQKNNVPVYLISGGFRSIILSKAKELNISPENVFSNKLLFYFNGSYAGMDLREPTSDNFDIESCPPADICIGYGGNVVRSEVKSKADWFVMDFKTISDSFGKC